jgi:hypothetical protein
VTVTVASVDSKAITGFRFTNPAVTGDIDETAKTIRISVPTGTDLTNLIPAITHTGASVSPESGAAQNFTNPVTYTVTARDGSTVTYTVTVTTVSVDSKTITGFSFTNPAVTGTINESAKTIAVTVPSGTDRSALIPTITHTGASISPESGAAQNFTNPVTYTVTARDGSTMAYTVTVTVASLDSSKAITDFRFTNPAVTGTINETDTTIAVIVPYGTDRSALVPTITHTGASISPESGTAQNFTNPVKYTVTAENGSTLEYTVTVNIADAPRAITAFSFTSQAATGIISGTNITVIVPYNTNVSSLTPTIAVSSGATITPASGTVRDFSSPVEYTVTGADAKTAKYTVTVIVRGQGGITLVYPNLTYPTDEANGELSGSAITIVKGQNDGTEKHDLTVVGTFDTYRWRVDGAIKGYDSSLTLNADDYKVGVHQLSLEVTTSDGKVYSKSGSFEVQ